MVSVTWDATLLATADGSAVEVRVVGHASTGTARTVEVGAVQWLSRSADDELYFLRARYYDPDTGRFMGRDPLQVDQRYAYVGNNPTLYVDPGGLLREFANWLVGAPPTEWEAAARSPLRGMLVHDMSDPGYYGLGHVSGSPVSGRVNLSFNSASDPYSEDNRHRGLDIGQNAGQVVRAPQVGEVVVSGTHTGYGNYVVLEHSDGSRTLYAHLSDPSALIAQQLVLPGDRIGTVGCTGHCDGPHLHLEMQILNQDGSYGLVDPLEYARLR